VYLVLGEKWLPSTWFFQMVCGLGIIHVGYLLNADLLRSLGKTRVFFRVNMLCAGLQVAFVACGLHWGVRGMVVGDVSARFVAALVMVFVVAKNSPVRSGDQVREILRSLVWVGPLLLLLLGLKLGVDNMLAKVVVGLVVCMAMTWFWWKCEGRRVSNMV
jgi:O-antigen/teichoic acid export membrane protein